MFIYPVASRISSMTRVVSYSARSVGKRGGHSRHALLLGAGVVEAMGWRPGMKIAAGYGAPGSEVAGWMELKPSDGGVMLRASGKDALKVDIHTYPDFVIDRQHAVEHCAQWKRVGDALRVKLPDWVFKPYTAERGDHPHAGKPKTGEPDNSSHAKAGGGESSGSPDAPPAEISRGADTARGKPGEKPLPAVRSSSRPGPEDGSDDLSVNAHAGNRLESRDALAGEAVGVAAGETAPISSSGPGEANGTTLKGEMAGHTGGEEAATVAPPVREPGELTEKQRAVYDLLRRAARNGDETPRLIDLARAVGSEDPAVGSYHLAVLFKMGYVRREGSQADVTYHVVALGKSTVSRALRRAAIAKKPVEKPIADARGGVAPVNGHSAQALAEKPRRVTQPAPSTAEAGRPDKAIARIVNGPVTAEHVIAWLNDEARLTCHKLGSDNYLLGDEYVGWRHVIARANRMRRVRKEPEFTVA